VPRAAPQVCTDAASRGLDVQGVAHVVQVRAMIGETAVLVRVTLRFASIRANVGLHCVGHTMRVGLCWWTGRADAGSASGTERTCVNTVLRHSQLPKLETSWGGLDASCCAVSPHPPSKADFAPNAIDFIHRIGRTARAGASGRVTSLYREANRPLVEVG
jgi:superfamily II DNA/RNA helicase